MEDNFLTSKYLIERFNIVRALVDEMKHLIGLQEVIVGKELSPKEIQYFKYQLTGIEIANQQGFDKTIEHNVVKLLKSCVDEKTFLPEVHKYCSLAYTNIASQMTTISDFILKDFKEPTPNDSITPKQKSILTLVDEIASFYEVVYQFTDFFYEYSLGSQENTSITLSNKFGVLLILMLNKHYIKVQLNSEDNDEITYSLNDDTENIKNFTGNPIYHLALWWVNLSKETLQMANERKNLIELKLQQLKLKQNNDFSPRLAKQIKFYKDELDLTERKINRILLKKKPKKVLVPEQNEITHLDNTSHDTSTVNLFSL